MVLALLSLVIDTNMYRYLFVETHPFKNKKKKLTEIIIKKLYTFEKTIIIFRLIVNIQNKFHIRWKQFDPFLFLILLFLRFGCTRFWKFQDFPTEEKKKKKLSAYLSAFRVLQLFAFSGLLLVRFCHFTLQSGPMRLGWQTFVWNCPGPVLSYTRQHERWYKILYVHDIRARFVVK